MIVVATTLQKHVCKVAQQRTSCRLGLLLVTELAASGLIEDERKQTYTHIYVSGKISPYFFVRLLPCCSFFRLLDPLQQH